MACNKQVEKRVERRRRLCRFDNNTFRVAIQEADSEGGVERTKGTRLMVRMRMVRGGEEERDERKNEQAMSNSERTHSRRKQRMDGSLSELSRHDRRKATATSTRRNQLEGGKPGKKKKTRRQRQCRACVPAFCLKGEKKRRKKRSET